MKTKIMAIKCERCGSKGKIVRIIEFYRMEIRYEVKDRLRDRGGVTDTYSGTVGIQVQCECGHRWRRRQNAKVSELDIV